MRFGHSLLIAFLQTKMQSLIMAKMSSFCHTLASAYLHVYLSSLFIFGVLWVPVSSADIKQSCKDLPMSWHIDTQDS